MNYLKSERVLRSFNIVQTVVHNVLETSPLFGGEIKRELIRSNQVSFETYKTLCSDENTLIASKKEQVIFKFIKLNH